MTGKALLAKLAVAASISLIATTAAHATITTATYTGTVTGGFDNVGFLGTPGASLVGKSYTATYSIDDTVAAIYYATPGESSQILGGSAWGFPSSPVSGTINIGGITFIVLGNNIAAVTQLDVPGAHGEHHELHDIFDFPGGSSNAVLSNNIYGYNDSVNVWDFHGPLHHDVLPDEQADGAFALWSYSDKGGYDYSIVANLTPTSVTITSSSPVPEPGAWAMMICGFGLVGTLARRRRVPAVA